MAKDTEQIPGSSVEGSGMNDSLVINPDGSNFISVVGAISNGSKLERMYGKVLYKRTNSPILAIHVTYGAVWVQTSAKLVLFTFADFKNIAIAFP